MGLGVLGLGVLQCVKKELQDQNTSIRIWLELSVLRSQEGKGTHSPQVYIDAQSPRSGWEGKQEHQADWRVNIAPLPHSLSGPPGHTLLWKCVASICPD